MREIKFRAWNEADEKMEFPRNFCMGLGFNGGFKPLINFADGTRAFKDYPIMQFTGMHDKNGKEIYEGDIVKTTDYIGGNFIENIYKKYQVVFFRFGFTLKPIQPSQYTASLVSDNIIEIIGNIHENPELLKE